MKAIPKAIREEIQHAPAQDPGRSDYLAYCAGIEPMLKLALLGQPSQIRDRCRTKAQAKRVTREMINRYDGCPPLDVMRERMREQWSKDDYDLGGLMHQLVGQWTDAIRSAIPGRDPERILLIATGEAPLITRRLMDCGFFAPTYGIPPRARAYADALGEARHDDRGDRMRSVPKGSEDVF